MTVLRTARMRRRALGLGLAIAVTAGAAGCSPTPKPDPTPTSAFASEDEAFAAAEETYRAYIDAFNSVDLTDPSSFAPVFDYTAGDYESSEREALSEMHAEGYIRGGAIEILNFRGTSVGTDGEVRAVTCNDVSSTTFTDTDGNNLVPSDRPERYALDLTFIVIEASLLLTAADPIEDEGCASD